MDQDVLRAVFQISWDCYRVPADRMSVTVAFLGNKFTRFLWNNQSGTDLLLDFQRTFDVENKTFFKVSKMTKIVSIFLIIFFLFCFCQEYV